MMLIIAAPTPMKNWNNRTVAKFWATKKPNVPTAKDAIPKRNSDLCLNFNEMAPIAKPIIKPIRLLINPSWLAVPIETLNDEAMSTRSVLVKTLIEYARNVPNSTAGSSSTLLKPLLTADFSFIKHQTFKPVFRTCERRKQRLNLPVNHVGMISGFSKASVEGLDLIYVRFLKFP